ncbi:fungal-specific transcription factor domain-containing protein [Limtongia smithiae]|uniref:fungal-specific transcription factor domain-containing protein n=1 Tax=Limtongia smithiae TaxID=1125753 RepID=UPI0034CD5EFA
MVSSAGASPAPPLKHKASVATTSDAAGAKRRRVSLACSQCRTRKARCDGRTPSCSACLATHQACTYNPDSSKKRGLPTGHAHEMELRTAIFERVLGLIVARDRALEAAILAVFDAALESKSLEPVWPESLDGPSLRSFFEGWRASPLMGRMDALVDRVKDKYGASAGRRRSLIISNTFASPEPAMDVDSPARPSTTLAYPSPKQSVDHLAALSGSPLSLLAAAASSTRSPAPTAWIPAASYSVPPRVAKTTPHIEYLPDAAGKFFKHTNGALCYVGAASGLLGGTVQQIARPTAQFSEMRPFDSIVPSYSNHPRVRADLAAENLMIKPLPRNASQLLNLYFATTHCWLPIVDRFSIIRLAHQDDSHSVALSRPRDVAERGLLWTVLALAAAYMDQENSAAQTAPSREYAFTAIEALSLSSSLTDGRDDLNAEIACTQCQLLLSLYYFGKGNWTDAWNFVTEACQSAFNNCLYFNDVIPAAAAGGTDAQLQRRRAHTWAGCYILDTMVASRTGHIPNIRTAEWEIPVLDENGADEWDNYSSPAVLNGPNGDAGAHANPARCISTFNHLLKLVRIWNQVLASSFYAPVKAMDSDAHSSSYNLGTMVDSFLGQLKAWEGALPSQCSIRASAPKPTPYLINLNMTYLLVQALVYSAVFNHPSISTQSADNSLLIATTARSYMLTLQGVSQLLSLVLESRTLYSNLLPPTFEYNVFRAITFLPNGNFQAVVNLMANDYAILVRHAQEYLGLIARVWPSALVSLRILCSENATIAAPIPKQEFTIPMREPLENSPPQAVPLQRSSNVSSLPNHTNELDSVLSSTLGVLDEPATSSSSATDLAGLTLFDIKASGDDGRLEQFMQNLGYVNGLDVDLMMTNDMLLDIGTGR